MNAPRRRLAPEERRAELLDHAESIVMEEGVPACTVEAVSQRAGVTPQLTHRYLGTRTEMLGALLRRERDRYGKALRTQLDGVTDFEAVLRIFVTTNFDQLSHRTAHGRLIGTPELADVESELLNRDSRTTQRLLVRLLNRSVDLAPNDIEFALRISSTVSIEASNLSAARDGDPAADIERTMRYILGGIGALEQATKRR